jgi:2-methylcitrate dehydratase PrpD
MHTQEDPASALADFTLQLDSSCLPREPLEAAKRCLIDYFAVVLAASKELVVRVLADYLADQRGDCSVIGLPLRSSPEGAAFANGALGHYLDYDDVKPRLGHGTVVIAPAVLALGEKLHKSGLEILTAFIAGFEVSSRIANSVEPSHSQQGWHNTSTCGVFGAAAACAKLLNLDVPALLGAFGTAASLACGIRRNLGTPIKPFHAGQAAQSGLKAAVLSSLKIYGARDVFSGKHSFGEVFASPHQEAELSRGLGKEFEILKNGIKIFPCCASAHTAIDAALALRGQYGLRPEDVETVQVGTVPLVLDNLIYKNPQNIVECRFSMQFCVALALSDGFVNLDNFSARRLADPVMQDLMQRISLHQDPQMVSLGYRGTENARVMVKTRGGREVQRRIDIARGMAANPIADSDLLEKFRICSRGAAPAERVEEILSSLIAFEKLRDVKDLLRFG